MHMHHQKYQMSPVIVGTMTRTRVATMYRVSSSVCVCASYGGGEEGSSVGRVDYVCFCVAIVTACTEFASEYSIDRATLRSRK